MLSIFARLLPQELRARLRPWSFVIFFSLLAISAGVGVVRNWKVTNHPPCVSFLDQAQLAALSGEPLGEPEVTASLGSCVADWGNVRVHMHCLTENEPHDQWERRAESWRNEPGFVSLRDLDVRKIGAPFTPPKLGVMEQIRFGGHIRSIRMLAPRGLGWIEVAVTHHWPDSGQPPSLTGDVEAALTRAFLSGLPSSPGCEPINN